MQEQAHQGLPSLQRHLRALVDSVHYSRELGLRFRSGPAGRLTATASSLVAPAAQIGGGVLGIINGVNSGGARGGLEAAGGR